MIDGKPVLDVRTLSMKPKAVRLEIDQLTTSGDADSFLVAAKTGSRACPAKWVLVTLRPGDRVEATEPFGTCEDYAHLNETGGRIVVKMFAQNNPNLWVSYVHEDGGLTKSRSPVRRSDMGAW